MRLICPCTLFCFSNSRQSKQNTLLSQTASDAQYALTSRRDSNSSFELGGTLLMSGVSLLMSHDDDLKAGMADVSYIVAGSCVRACARRGRCQGEKCPRFRPTDRPTRRICRGRLISRRVGEVESKRCIARRPGGLRAQLQFRRIRFLFRSWEGVGSQVISTNQLRT